jgi:hypothetical protein
LLPAALLPALVLSGCGTGGSAAPEPKPLERVAASASPSATPGPPRLPAVTRGDSERAAAAFVKHYIDVLNYAARTLDTEPMLALSSSDCAACSSISDLLLDVEASGGHIEGGAWSVLEVIALPHPTAGQRKMHVVIQAEPQRMYESPAQEPRAFPGGRTLFTFSVKVRARGWEVLRIEGDDV